MAKSSLSRSSAAKNQAVSAAIASPVFPDSASCFFYPNTSYRKEPDFSRAKAEKGRSKSKIHQNSPLFSNSRGISGEILFCVIAFAGTPARAHTVYAPVSMTAQFQETMQWILAQIWWLY